MPTAIRIGQTLPEIDEGTTRVQGHRLQPALGRVLDLRKRLDGDERGDAEEMHRLAAPVAAVVLDAFGKDEAAAEFLKQPKQQISDKRNGARGLMLWELVALLAAEPEAFIAFARLFCEVHGFELPQPKSPLTRGELAEMALALMSAGPLMALLVNEAQRRRGASEQDVAVALVTESDSK